MEKTFLITGAAGFIGSSITRILLSRGHRVIGLDYLLGGNQERLTQLSAQYPGQFIFEKGDIRDLAQCRDAYRHGIDYVLHHAALASVPQSVLDPTLFQQNNEMGTLNMLTAAKEAQVKRFVFASSSAVYGNATHMPISEKTHLSPKSPYAINKLNGELYASFFYEHYGLPTVSLRYFNVFGPGQDPHGPYAAVIPLFIQAMKHNQMPIIYGNGEQLRDFIYIDNVVEANLAACEAPSQVFGKALNIGSGQGTSINTLATLIKTYTHYTGEISYRSQRSGDIIESVSDPSLSHKYLTSYQKVDFTTGLKNTVLFY